MDDKENGPELDARTLQKRAAAAASRSEKRERMGEEAFLLEKRGWRKRKADRQTAAAAADAAAQSQQQPMPPPAGIAGQLSRLAELWTQGLLDDEEFKAAKALALRTAPGVTADGPPAAPPPPQPQPQQQPQQPPQAQAQPQQPPSRPPAQEQPWRRGPHPVREAAVRLVEAWLLSDQSDVALDTRTALTAEDRAYVAAFAERRGLEHETVETSDGLLLRILPSPPPPPAEAATAAAPPGAAAADTAPADTTAADAAAHAATADAAAPAPPEAESAPPAPPEEAEPADAEADAANAAAAAAAADAPNADADAAGAGAAAAPGQATLNDLGGVVGAAEQSELSDALGVSSALYLCAADVLKLRAMIEQPEDPAHLLRVLRRLSSVPMTLQLDATSGMVAFFAELQADETVCAAVGAGVEEAVQAVALMARTARVWEKQLEEQRRERATRLERRQHAAEPATKEKKAKDPNCAACQGRHRAHTCK